MIDLFNKALLYIATLILKLVDFIFSLFKIAGGVDKVIFNNNNGNSYASNILNGILQQKMVYKIFFFMLLIGVAIGAIFSVYAILKNSIKLKKSNAKIAYQYLFSILGMFVIFILIFVFIYVVSALLNAIMISFSIGQDNNLTIGNRIVKAMGDTAILSGKEEMYNSLFREDSNGVVGIYRDNFVDAFYGNLKDDLGVLKYHLDGTGVINPRTFQVFIVLVASCVIGWCSITAILQLAIRIYDIIFMILVLPLPLAAYPLDDGERYKLWKKTLISKMFLAYGVIIAVNIYILLIPIINSLSLPENTSLISTNMGNSENVSVFLFDLFKLFLIIAGGFTIANGQLLFARIMGTDAEEGRQARQTFRNALSGVGSAIGLAKGAKNVIFGKKQQSSGASSTKSATSDGGKYSRLGKGSVFKAAGKAGVVGAGVNIASKMGRLAFGSGSGKRLADKIGTSFKNSGLSAGLGALSSMVRTQGVKGLSYAGLSMKYGLSVYKDNKNQREALRKQRQETKKSNKEYLNSMSKTERKNYKKEHKKREKDLNFTFRNNKEN